MAGCVEPEYPRISPCYLDQPIKEDSIAIETLLAVAEKLFCSLGWTGGVLGGSAHLLDGGAEDGGRECQPGEHG